MEIWNGKEWILMDDLSGIEWDEFENFEALVEQDADHVDFIVDTTDEVADRMMTDPEYYDSVVGWF